MSGHIKNAITHLIDAHKSTSATEVRHIAVLSAIAEALIAIAWSLAG